MFRVRKRRLVPYTVQNLCLIEKTSDNNHFLGGGGGRGYIYLCLELLIIRNKTSQQSVTCLATDASLSADPVVASSIPARSHTLLSWRLIMK